MNDPVPGPPPAESSGAPEMLPCVPARLLRMTRGFSCLFWGMPLLASAHAVALVGLLPVRWTIGLTLACFLPLVLGLWLLRVIGNLTPRWGRRIGFVLLMSLVAMYLSPFLAWWSMAPMQSYFALNAAAHYVMLIVLLVGLNRLAAESARWLGDTSLRREAKAGVGMVLWLSGCTVGALLFLFHRAGVLQAGLPTVLAQLAQLPREARILFVLPYAMTAYVMFRAKETALRHMVRSAA